MQFRQVAQRGMAIGMVMFFSLAAGAANAADHVMVRGKPDPSAYLDFLSQTRDYSAKLQQSIAELATARVKAKQDSDIYEMNRDLRSRGGMSDEDFQTSIFRKKASDAEAVRLQYDVARLTAALAVTHAQADFSGGKPITLEQVYASYKARWNAECEQAEAGVVAAQAALDYQKYLYGVTERLYQISQVSREELIMKNTLYQSAINDLNGHKALAAICPNGLPTMEMIQDMFDRSIAGP